MTQAITQAPSTQAPLAPPGTATTRQATA